MAGEGAEPLVLSLKQMFSQGSISVTLAGLTKAERNRRIAFYDETLVVNIRFSISASDKTLPSPSSKDHAAVFTLPFEARGEDEEEMNDDRPNESPPQLLVLLLSSMQIFLDASYTAPRLSSPPSSNTQRGAGADDVAPLSNHVAPASEKADLAYQNIALQVSSSTGETTRIFSTTWNALGVPIEVESSEYSRMDFETEKDSQASVSNGGEITYAEKNDGGNWIVDWRCRLPVTFVKSRHPTSVLLLSAGMTLRLQPSNLARLAPSLIRPLVSCTAAESVFMHDLLNPLSEGPSYPDESPAERAAKANASLAKLPLGRLPSSILGSRLVTPARNAKEMGLLSAKRSAIENGDMGDAKDFSKRDHHRRTLTNEGLLASSFGDDTSKREQVQRSLDEEVTILQRSARKVLDVQSAIMVRMRTIMVPNFDVKSTNSESATLPTLILCVKVENPLDSGMQYALDKADVSILSPPRSTTHLVDAKKGIAFHITMTRIGDAIEPLIIKQGCQYNFLYRAEFEVDMDSFESVEGITDSLNETLRNASIKLFGKPIFSTEDKVTNVAPISKFVSTWTCTLEFAPQMRMLGLRKMIQNGAGTTSLRGGSDKTMFRPSGARFASTSSTIVEEKQQRPSSPYSRRSETASALPSNDTPYRSSPSAHRPSLRVNPSMRDESFVSLNRSEMDQSGKSSSNALSSAAVGQSILARARQSRQGDDSRQLLTGSPRLPDEFSHDTIPNQRTITTGGLSHRRAKTSSISLDTDVNALLPLNDKRSGAIIQRLLINPLDERGLLIDIHAVSTDEEEGAVKSRGYRRARVEVQIENRSEAERVVLLSWKRPKIQKDIDDQMTLFDDDDVQVGPIQGQDSDVATLDLYFTTSGVQTLPPLGVYETSTGLERVLHGLQTIVV